jgi:tetratricopeptide (TPR) repeat protein
MNKASALNRLEKTDESKELYQRAIELLEKSLEIDPLDTELWVNKGNCLEVLTDYDNAEDCYKRALKINPNNIDALSGLGGISADIKYDFVNSLEISHQLVMISPSDVSCKMDYLEDLLKMGKNQEVREEGLTLKSKASLNYHQCLIRFFIFSSWLFEGNWEMSNKAFTDFIEYYQGLTEPLVITSNIWRFNGLTEYTKKSSVDLQSKFLELTIIDLLQGKIKREDLRFTEFFRSL